MRASCTKPKNRAGKTPAKKAVKKSASNEFGEGNYKASRRYDKAQEDFVHAHKSEIPAMARQAEKDLEGPEGAELKAAEQEGKGHAAGEDR